MPLKYRNSGTAFKVEVISVEPIFLNDTFLIEFRDMVTMQGGRVSFRRVNPGLMEVAFTDLSQGVVPRRAVPDPVSPENTLAIINYTILWLKNLQRLSMPGAFDIAKPPDFDGLDTLEKLAKQIQGDLFEHYQSSE